GVSTMSNTDWIAEQYCGCRNEHWPWNGYVLGSSGSYLAKGLEGSNSFFAPVPLAENAISSSWRLNETAAISLANGCPGSVPEYGGTTSEPPGKVGSGRGAPSSSHGLRAPYSKGGRRVERVSDLRALTPRPPGSGRRARPRSRPRS